MFTPKVYLHYYFYLSVVLIDYCKCLSFFDCYYDKQVNSVVDYPTKWGKRELVSNNEMKKNIHHNFLSKCF